MEIKVTNPKWMQDSTGLWLQLKVEPQYKEMAKEFCGIAKEVIYAATIKQYRKRRSKDANAFCWVLIGKLAIALRTSPEEVYRNAIREIGDNFEILPIRNDAVDRWREIWQSKGLGWVCETLGESKLDGYTNMVNYYGSSVYDTRQMSALIDCIVSECKEQDIPTETPEQRARFKREWQE